MLELKEKRKFNYVTLVLLGVAIVLSVLAYFRVL